MVLIIVDSHSKPPRFAKAKGLLATVIKGDFLILEWGKIGI